MKKVAIQNYDSRSTTITASSVFQIVLGFLAACAGIVLSVSQRLLHYFFDFPGQSLSILLVVFFAIAFWLMEKGTRGIHLSRRFAKLDDALSEGPVSFSRMLTRMNITEKELLSDIARMIRHGKFWTSVAVLDDCIVFERDSAARPQMLMADEGMTFSEKKRRSRVPFGLLGGVCIGAALTHPFRFPVVLVTLLASFVFYNISFVLYPKNYPSIRYQQLRGTEKAPEPIPAKEPADSEKTNSLIEQGQEHLRELTTLGVVITDPHVRMRIEQICTSTRQLLGLLKSHPEKQGQARQSIEYCLPTAIKLLKQYDELSSQPVKGENIRESLEKITEMSDMVAEIMNRELDSLYGDRALNIEVDIEVMKSMMQDSMNIAAPAAPDVPFELTLVEAPSAEEEARG